MIYCDCDCTGCEMFHQHDLDGSRDANYSRILHALDMSVRAAAIARGIPACDCIGLGDGKSDVMPDACALGSLHTRCALLAGAIANVIDDTRIAQAADIDFKAFREDVEKTFAKRGS